MGHLDRDLSAERSHPGGRNSRNCRLSPALSHLLNGVGFLVGF